MLQNQNPELHGQMSTKEKLHKANYLGELAEKHVQVEALKRGAEVYPNFIKVGKTDLILKINDKLYEFNVKCKQWDKKDKCWKAKNAWSVKPPQWPILVEIHSDHIEIKWPNQWGKKNEYKCPPGLEDFWK